MRTRSTFSTGSRLARQWSYWHQDRAPRPPIHASRFRADATASFQLRRGGMRTPGESPAFFFMRSIPRSVQPSEEQSGRQQLLAFGPVECLVERARELVEQFIDLGRLDDHRRADGNYIAADEAHDQAFGLGVAHHLRADA